MPFRCGHGRGFAESRIFPPDIRPWLKILAPPNQGFRHQCQCFPLKLWNKDKTPNLSHTRKIWGDYRRELAAGGEGMRLLGQFSKKRQGGDRILQPDEKNPFSRDFSCQKGAPGKIGRDQPFQIIPDMKNGREELRAMPQSEA